MKKTTLKDIARALNTSIATVSRALYNSDEISEKMKNRVREVAQLYNYKPNSTALSLKFHKSYALGVILPRLSHYYFSEVLSGLLQEATRNGYKLIIAESKYNVNKELEYIQEFYEMNVDGIFILPSRKLSIKKTRLEQQIRDDVPFLFIDRRIDLDKKEIPFITSDDYVGTREGIEHLIEQGYHNIAHLKGLETSSIANIRHQAYMDTLIKNKLEINNNLIISCKYFTIEEGELLACRLMNAKEIPDAFFCINDHIAIGVLKALKKLGYRVPQDVGVLGFSDSDISAVCTPLLSTIHQPGREIGKKAVLLILSNINGKEVISSKHIVLKTKLIKRESTQRV